ncbi:uncharacterized protein LOC135496212 isoform X2 [Lineus longissimus]|uniref:uncharacterized protein LOC135496212 isoform X2 n=1 Tax=Lineus longissimus TaxID=88925 RepID=UPI00315D2417
MDTQDLFQNNQHVIMEGRSETCQCGGADHHRKRLVRGHDCRGQGQQHGRRTWLTPLYAFTASFILRTFHWIAAMLFLLDTRRLASILFGILFQWSKSVSLAQGSVILLTILGFFKSSLGISMTVTNNPSYILTGTNCWNMTDEEWSRKIFHTTDYPDNYKNETDCAQLLIAPRGYIVQLDTRDAFHIEETPDCVYDFLEFRDGPYGYSPLLGRYCGNIHPPIITSASRYLWTRFRSDDTIERLGFKAVFTYIKDPKAIEIDNSRNFTGQQGDMGSDDDADYQVCRIALNEYNTPSRLDGTISSRHSIPKWVISRSELHNLPFNCTWEINAPRNYQISLRFLYIKDMLSKKCKDSAIEIYDGRSLESDRKAKLCTNNAIDYLSTYNRVMIRLYSRDVNQRASFQVQYTLFTSGHSGICTSYGYRCAANICINNTLLCNGRENCQSGSDETYCDGATATVDTPAGSGMTDYHTIILGVIGGILFIFIVICGCTICVHKSNEISRRKKAKKLEKAAKKGVSKGKGGKGKSKKQRPNVEMRNLLNQTPPLPPHMTSHMMMDGAVGGATALPMDGRGRHYVEDYDHRGYNDPYEPRLQGTPYPDRNAESPNHIIIDNLQRKNSIGTQTPGTSRSPGMSRSPHDVSRSPRDYPMPNPSSRSPHDYPMPNAYFEPISGPIDRYVSLTHPESPLPALRATEIPSLRAGEGTPQKTITVQIERACTPVHSHVTAGTSTSYSEEPLAPYHDRPRHKVSRSSSAHDSIRRTPSPRPDIIQDGVYTYTTATAPHSLSNHCFPNHERKTSLPETRKENHQFQGKKSRANQAQPV